MNLIVVSCLLIAVFSISLYLYYSYRSLENLILFTYHEVRGQLTLIYGYGELLQQGLEVDKIKSYSDTILASALQIDQTLDGLRRIERGQIEKKRTELSSLLQEILNEIEPLYQDRKISLSLEKEAPPLAIDPVLIKLAVINLIKNACQYSSQGSSIQLVCKKEGTYQKIEVQDEGKGVIPQQLPLIFRRLYSTQQGRMGMGLYLVKKIAHLHRGKIEVTSTLGKGSTFSLSIPELSK